MDGGTWQQFWRVTEGTAAWSVFGASDGVTDADETDAGVVDANANTGHSLGAERVGHMFGVWL